jgi:phosphohistidine phosphatase SixA
MDKELDRLRRRPFLFPLLFPVVALLALVAGAAWVFDARSTTVILAVRHAEIEPQGSAVNPALSAEGRDRAIRLARMLAEIRPVRGIDAIFASEGSSLQTVIPVSEQLALPVNSVPTATWNDLPSQILRRHRGEYVLVSGSSPSITALVGKLAGSVPPTIRDDEYDAMFIIFVPQIASPKVVRIRY